MRSVYVYILIVLCLLSNDASARTWYVKPDSTGQAINIQAGIDSCGYGDTVLVASGVFRGDGNRDLDFKGKPIVVLAESRYDTTITDSTVIDCEGSSESCHRGFYFHSGETSTSIVEGLIIINGYSRPSGGRIAWGLDCERKPIVVMSADQFDSRKMVMDCIERHREFYSRRGKENAPVLEESFALANRAALHEEDRPSEYFGNEIASDMQFNGMVAWDDENSGGGILCDSISSPTISHNAIKNCYSNVGGGICCKASSPIIMYNDIDSNHALSAGCGIYCLSSSPLVAFNKIHNVYEYWHYASGVGIYCDLSAPTINHNDIYDNFSAGSPGCGIYCDSCSIATISGNNVYSNGGANFGGGIYLSHSSASITDNEIWKHWEGAISISSSSAVIAGNEMHGNDVYGSGGVVECYNSIATIDSNYFHENSLHDYDPLGPTSVLAISSSRAVIRNNQIISNFSGGIVFWGDSTGAIEKNTVADNGGAGSGSHGAIDCYSPVNIIGNTIRNNSRSRSNSSGGICCSSSALIKDNIVVNNISGPNGGGGIHCTGSSPSIINNTIVGNEASHGAGILIDAQSHPTLASNIIANNRIYDCEGCSNEGGGIYSESDSIIISCCDVYDNEGGNYIGMLDPTGTNDNFSADPIFCNVGSGDYSLYKLSPCIAGNHPNGADCGLIGALGQGCDSVIVAALLQEQHAEIVTAAIEVKWVLSDIGERMHFFVLRAEMPNTEYEEILNASISREGLSFAFRDTDCKPGAVYQYRVDVSDEAGRRILFETDPISMPALKFALYQNYPNPFNPSTKIGYSLPEKCRVRIEVYDISGRHVASLVDGVQASGFHPVVWNGVDERGGSVASGVYFCRLTSGKETVSKKMVLLK